MRCTTHLVYAVDKETLQERIRVLFFSGLVSLVAKVAAIRKLATPSRNLRKDWLCETEPISAVHILHVKRTNRSCKLIKLNNSRNTLCEAEYTINLRERKNI